MKVAFRKGVSGVELSGIIDSIASGTPFQYMLLMQPGDAVFAAFDRKSSWADWEQGVVFGLAGELRWRRRRGGLFHLVSLSPNLPLNFTDMGEVRRIGEAVVYLWGERICDSQGQPTNAWFEGRIPQIITGNRGYPLPVSGARPPLRVALRVELLELTPPSPGQNDPDFSPPRRLERFLKPVEVPQP